MLGTVHSKAEPFMQLKRIRSATVATPYLDATAQALMALLNFHIRDRGRIPREVAALWCAPAMEKREYVLLSSDEYPDVWLRLVEITPVEGYRPFWSFGWNSFEISVANLDELFMRLRSETAAFFRIRGEPHALRTYPSIRAMQIEGRSGEIYYLTEETATGNSPVPPTRHRGRLFITVLGAVSIEQSRNFYAEHFNLSARPIRASTGQVVQRAWGGTPDGTHPITLLPLMEPANAIEMNGYVREGIGERVRSDGELPPGNSLVTFEVDRIEALPEEMSLTLAHPPGLFYQGCYTGFFVGPSGEWVELIERRS